MKEDNHFLDSLTPTSLGRLQPHLTRMDLNRDKGLVEAGQRVEYAYLPINCVISVVAVMRDGRSVETRTIGCESGFGLLHALGSSISFESVFTQIGGKAWRIPLPALAAATQADPALVQAVARHAQATILQAAQGAACNSLHAAEHRLA